MLNKMSEAQRSMLQAAAKREDRLLEPPGKARGAVAKSLAAKLIDAGLVKEIKASNCTPVGRRDAATGDAFALKLTAKGLKAAGTEEPKGSKNRLLPAEAEAAPTKERAQTSTCPRHIQGGPTEDKPRDLAFSSTARAPRSGSKIGEVLCRLGR